VEDLHGERIVDPYRWLEDGSTARTREWTAAQNRRTRAALDALPHRARVRDRVRELVATGLLDVPRPRGRRLFYARRAGDQLQAALYVREPLGPDRGEDRALVDPNALDADGLVALDWYYPSPDGGFVAYGLSRGGDELSTLHVLDIATGRDLGERIPHTQRADVAWASTSRSVDGFYYTVHPAPGSVPPGEEHYHRRVRFHRLGADPRGDPIVFGEGRPKEDILAASASPDGRWIVFTAARGWTSNDVYLLDRSDPVRLRTVVETTDGLTWAQPLDGRLWLLTSLDAPNYRVAVADCEAPERPRWRTVVPEREHAITAARATRERLLVASLEHAASRLEMRGLDGARERDVPLPGLVSVLGLASDAATGTFSYALQSFLRPTAAYLLTASGEPRESVALPSPPASGGPGLVAERSAYRSADGTEVTMFLVHRSDVRPNGDVPTVLNAYGGFALSRTPTYLPGAALWAQAGGLFAVASIRGGGEHGERWHRAGMLAHKQNAFDDFHAAAEHLIASGWTRPERLGALGGSNGGLLVGAALTQRPELFRAIVCTVPLLDMLRYHHHLIARFWIPEYGSADDAEQFRWLRAYSPYHHVREGVRYPAVLLVTAEGDSRVDPMHARKMAALLQSRADAGCVLLRVDSEAGHGVGKPLDKQVDDLADTWSFFVWQLGLGAIE